MDRCAPGIFRICCEYVIRTMRKGRETLLTLLEAFVYDPLVDWTTGNEGGYTGAFYGGGHTGNSVLGGQQSKKDMERDITLSMFSIRMAEMRSSWTQNRENMLGSLPKLQASVRGHLSSLNKLNDGDTYIEKLHKQQLYLEEALEDTDHMIYTLPKRYEEYGVVVSTRTDALQAVQEKMNECEQWHKAHLYAIDAIKGDKLQKMCAEVNKPVTVSLSCFELVTDFLNGAGQSQLVTQCEGVSSELAAVVHQRKVILRSCLDVLHTYATIVSNFPGSFIEESRTIRWQHWLQDLVCAFTMDKCKEIQTTTQKLYGTAIHSAAKLQAVLNVENKLKTMCTDINDKLVLLVQRRAHDTSDTSVLSGQVQDTSSAIHRFMQENGAAGTTCMTSVVVTALCSLSKRYLIMEGAAAGAGERLMDLTSREGDWFLDELCSMSGNVNQLLGLLSDPVVTQLLSADICQQVSQAMQCMHTVYMALQDLNVNFRTIILPETLKTLQAVEPSILATLAGLERLVQDCGQPLDGLVEQLEVQLRNAIMGLESTDNKTLSLVKKMRQQFDCLFLSLDPEVTSDLTPGQMLLMGFNGLFTQLGADFDAMLDMMGKIQTPDVWKKVDVVKEAKSIQLTAFNESTVGLLSHLFFVKQLKAMINFFTLAQETAKAVQEGNDSAIHDIETLSRPIKFFIAEYVRKHMIGLPSQTLGYVLCHYITALHVDVTAEIELRDIGAASKVALEDLCKKAVDMNVKNDVFQHIHLTQASSLVAANDLAWRKSDLALRLDQNINLLELSRQRAQLQVARYQWLCEDCLSQAGRAMNQLTVPLRATVMSELRKGIQALVHQEASVTTNQELHLQLESSVTQRLKWAAGANPTLSQVLQQFEDCLAAKNGFVQHEGILAGEVVTIGNALLHLEALRTDTPEAMAGDSAFLTLIGRCEEACALVDACKISVSEQEESIVQTKPLVAGEEINEIWIRSRMSDVESQVTTYQAKLEDLKKNVDLCKEGVHGVVGEIRGILTTHHKLMSDIRSILKSMAKQEEQDYGTEIVSGGIREYVNTYKTFSENFTTMMKMVMVDDMNPAVGKEIEEMIATLGGQIVSIYDLLVTFAPPLTYESPEDTMPQPSFATAVKRDAPAVISSPKRLPLSSLNKPDLLTGMSSGAQSPQTSTSTLQAKMGAPVSKKPDKITRDPRTGKAIQERNSYAVGVWRRVKTKLDGRDPDLNKRLTVAEQVEHVIKEATSLDNLAALYEGWTPWV